MGDVRIKSDLVSLELYTEKCSDEILSFPNFKMSFLLCHSYTNYLFQKDPQVGEVVGESTAERRLAVFDGSELWIHQVHYSIVFTYGDISISHDKHFFKNEAFW